MHMLAVGPINPGTGASSLAAVEIKMKTIVSHLGNRLPGKKWDAGLFITKLSHEFV